MDDAAKLFSAARRMDPQMSKPIEIGDRVAYSAKFLRDTGQIAGVVPTMRGTVASCVVDDLTAVYWRLLKVVWDGGAWSHVLDANLARVGSPEMSIN